MNQTNLSAGACGCQDSCEPMKTGAAGCRGAAKKGVAGPAPVAKAALATSGLTMAACVGCCVVPMVWPALAVGASSGLFAWMARSQRPLAWLSALVLALAWAALIRARRGQARSWGRLTGLIMALATILTVAALAWTAIEPVLLDALSMVAGC